MHAHRFQEQLSRLPATARFVGSMACGAFVSCPVFGAFSAAQQSQIQEVYRIAAERTREQLRRQWSRRPQFSLN